MAKNKSLELSIRIAGKLDKSLNRTVKQAGLELSALTNGMSRMAKLGAVAMTGMTVAATGTAAACIAEASKLEKSMAQVRTLLTGTAEETAARTRELTSEVLDISTATGRGAVEISEGMYQVVSAFGEAADAAGITAIATKASIAGQADMVDTVNALASVTKAYNDTSMEAVQRAADLSFETIRLGQTTMPELANGIQKASGSAAALGIAQEELYAGFAALTGVIGNTDTVGTALNTMYSKMLKPSKALTKAVNSMGYASAYAMVQAEGMGGAIEKLGKYTKGDATKFAALFSMRDLKAAQGILSAMDTYKAKLSQLQSAEGAADRAFVTSIDNLSDVTGIIKNAGAVFVEELGMRMLPYAKEFATDALPKIQSALGEVLDKVDEMIPRMEKVFGVMKERGPEAAAAAAAIAAAWAGMRFAPQIQSVTGGAADLVSGIGKRAGAGGAWAAGKIGSVLDFAKDAKKNPGLFSALPAMQYLGRVRNIPANAIAAMTAAANPAGTATATIGNVMGAGMESVFGGRGLNLTGAAGALLKGGFGAFASLMGTLGPIIAGMGVVVALVSMLGDHMNDLHGVIGSVFGEQGLAMFDRFTAGLQGIVGKIITLSSPEGLRGVQETIRGMFGDGAANAFGAIIPVISSIGNVFRQIVDLGVNHLKPMLTEVFNFFGNEALPIIGPLLGKIINLIGTVLVNAVKVLVDTFRGALPVAEAIFKGIAGLVDGVANLTISVVNNIIRALNMINFTLPEWLPIAGGKTFGFNLTEIPMLARGGFTNGPSIAGEAGREAVISFDPAVRRRNIDLWHSAGQMLGTEDGEMPSVTFAPNIVINGNADESTVRRTMGEAYEQFCTYMERYAREQRRKRFA